MGKRLLGAALAVAVGVTVSACAGAGPGNPGTFVPAGGSGQAANGQAAPGTAAPVPGLRNFAFPPSIKIVFQTPLPAGGPQRSAMIGYENYIDSMWYAVYTHGANTAYERYLSGNALKFAQGEISEFASGDYALRGTITYYNMDVPQVFFKAGAVVTSCVDASGLYRVSARTGKTAGTVFSGGFSHYQEQASAGKQPGGLWMIGHTANYPATSGGSAGECAA
ncbi:MAG: hypothetical protein JOY82_15965 [Streptosporangiaceae bacterium]|nr:hypothetical protein [Streptosporangiaceae bacterium]MBV9855988.1 hypothetical protein [Streptosporangiaceae bacterium]